MPDMVMGIYDATIFAQASRIAEFRIAQDAQSAITVLVRAAAPATEPDLSILAQFRDGLERLVDDTSITVRTEIVEQLPPVPSRKRRLITSAFAPRAGRRLVQQP